MDGDDDATWEEFGYQLRSGPTMTATPTTSAGQSQVELEWTEAPLSSAWSPAPGVSYAVTREDDEDLETIAENLTVFEYTDTDVAGETYIYQVVAVVDGGEPVRSAAGSVTVAGNKRPVAVGILRWRTLLVGDSAMTEVGGAFEGSGGRHHHLRRVLVGHQRRPGDPFGDAGDDHPGRRRPYVHHGDRYRRWVQPEQDSAVPGDGSAHHDG